MIYFLKEKKYKELLLLSAVYFLAHWMLLFVSGRWWDDWCFFNQEQKDLIDMGLQMGRPSLILIINFCKLFPEWFYRILVFFIYLYYSLTFYKVLNSIFKINSSYCLLICLISMVVPVNVERIMLCIFPYTLGMFFFAFGTSIFVDNFYCTKFSLLHRILMLISFLLSFVLNSNLFFYGIIILLLMYKKKKVLILEYFDFILLPILFFLCKSIYFTPFGLYDGYNSIKLISLIKAIPNTFKADAIVIIRVVSAALNANVSMSIRALFIFVLISIVYGLKSIIGLFEKLKSFVFELVNNRELHSQSVLPILLFVLGLLLLTISLYPYVVIRNTSNINIGRDAVLTSIGISILIFSFLIICYKKKVYNFLCITFIVLGILYFNRKYLEFQCKYYREVSLQLLLNDNQYISNFKTIAYAYGDDDVYLNNKIFSYAHHDLNAAFQEVYGNQNRLVLMYSDLNYFLGNTALLELLVKGPTSRMKDFDYNYNELDVILMHSIFFKCRDCISYRFYEAFDKKKFINVLKEKSSISLLYSNDDSFISKLKSLGVSDQLLKELKNVRQDH